MNGGISGNFIFKKLQFHSKADIFPFLSAIWIAISDVAIFEYPQ